MNIVIRELNVEVDQPGRAVYTSSGAVGFVAGQRSIQLTIKATVVDQHIDHKTLLDAIDGEYVLTKKPRPEPAFIPNGSAGIDDLIDTLQSERDETEERLSDRSGIW